ncbi:MAG: hypothetical protein EOP43_05535 [Sphingobacteriaceae bacterium]|nr:MAG: hypothetical protein EOP43_05535 [Sphingobacteriaceae bacterium]
MVFINQKSAAFTDTSGLLHYYFDYKLSFGNGPILISEHIPIYSDKVDYYKSLIQLKDDSRLLLNVDVKAKDAALMQGKSVVEYNKINSDVTYFIRKPNQQDLIGDWVSISKKDTILMFSFKNKTIVVVRNPINEKLSFCTYSINTDSQPMVMNITDDKGETKPYIFVLLNANSIRLAKPKRGLKRTLFTAFGGNIFLTKKLPRISN